MAVPPASIPNPKPAPAAPEVLHIDNRVISGRVHLVDLGSLAAEFGERWARVRERAMTLAENIIVSHLDWRDIYARHGDDRFVIMFAALPLKEAEVRCAIIARQIQAKLIGEAPAFSRVKVSTAVVAVDKAEVEGSANPMATLDKALASVPAARAVPQAAGIARAPSAAKATPTPVAAAAPPPAHALRLASKGALKFQFVPMWNVRANALSTYYCEPYLEGENGDYTVGYGVLPMGYQSESVGDLDSQVLAAAIREVRAGLAAGRRMLVALSVHLRTIESAKMGDGFVDRLRGADPAIRNSIVAEVVGLLTDAPASKMISTVGALRPWVRAVNVRCSVQRQRFDNLTPAGVHALSVYLGNQIGEETELATPLSVFCKRAKQRGFHTVAHGLRSRSLVSIAIGAGYDYIDGLAIGGAQRGSANVRPFEVMDLFRAPAPAAGAGRP